MFLRDLSRQHADRARIEQLAFRDPSTGLPNRAALGQRVDADLQQAPPGPMRYAVLRLEPAFERLAGAGDAAAVAVLEDVRDGTITR